MKLNKITENYILDMLKLRMQHKDREMVWMVLINREGLPFSFKCIVKWRCLRCQRFKKTYGRIAK